MFFEDLKANSLELLREICEWLNIDSSFYSDSVLEIENKTVNFNNKFFHQVARAINSKGEKILRANPQIKKVLRQVYYGVNGKAYEEEIPPETLAYLQSLYTPYNKQLANQLAAKEYTDLPGWLSRGY